MAGSTKATVYVRLKQEVLDPQGDAVRRALGTIGFSDVRGVRIGKIIEIELGSNHDNSTELAPGEIAASLKVRLADMADKLLANPVIEDYEIVIEGTP